MTSLKTLLLSATAAVGLISFCRHLNLRKIRILAYHGVDWLHDPVVNWDDLQVEPRVFRTHLDELRCHYEVVPLHRVIDALTGKDELPDNAVAITFDDGYRNNLTLAAPILKEFGFPAAFFIATGFVDGTVSPWWYQLRDALARCEKRTVPLPDGGMAALAGVQDRVRAAMEWEKALRPRPSADRNQHLAELLKQCGCREQEPAYPLMNRAEVQELADMGFEIGPHTVSHISMSHENAAVVEQEIDASLRSIRDMTGKEPTCYSYPYGLISGGRTEILDMMKSRGIRAAVTTAEGMVRRGDDVFQLNRLNVSGHRRSAFSALISGFTGAVRHD